MLNEEEHIERVVSGFLATDYSNLTEILVADGGSTDRTREIVSELNKKDARVKLVENPEKYQSFGLNRMIDVAQGEIFLRADGHCYYAEDYVVKCVQTLISTGAKNVGGAQRYKATNKVQAGIALAVKSFLGNGGAKYMQEDYEGYADTVFLGCFWTKDLKEIGGFNPRNITNQDSELNLRLIEHFGPCVYVSPQIKSWYFPRDTFSKLFKQYFRYGRGRFLTNTLHPKSSPIRGMVPFLALLFLIVLILVDVFSDIRLYSELIILSLFLLTMIESARIVIAKKKLLTTEIWEGASDKPSFILLLLSTNLDLILMQMGHFSGFLYQIGRRILFREKGW